MRGRSARAPARMVHGTASGRYGAPVPVEEPSSQGVVAGSLAERPLADVLRSLAGARATGILHLSGSYASIVCLRDGGVYLAHAETGPSLRQVFVATGVVSEPQWDRSIEASRQGGHLIDALLETGEATPERLRRALHDHTVNTLFELLVPNANHYRFGAGEVHQIGMHFTFPVDDVLDAAGARLAEFRALARVIPSTEVVTRVVPRLPEGTTELTVSAIEWQVLAAVDGRATVAEIITTVGHSAFTVFSALHHLLQVGALERVDAR